MSLLPSPEQHGFIKERPLTGNCILQACAGAGKTRCVVENIIEILEAQDNAIKAKLELATPPTTAEAKTGDITVVSKRELKEVTLGQICCTTFTKAGAREMMSRLKVRAPKAFVAGQVAEMYGTSGDDDEEDGENNDYVSSSDSDDDEDGSKPRKPAKPVARDRVVCGTFHSLSRRWLKRYAPELVRGTVFYVDEFIELFATWLQQESEQARKFASRFSHMFVDEFQDIDSTQYGILGVGDDAQNIYSWRGSNSGFMSKALVDFAGCQLMTLRYNFRSVDAIVHFCNRVLDTFEEKTLSPRQKPASELTLQRATPDSNVPEASTSVAAAESKGDAKQALVAPLAPRQQVSHEVKFGWDEIQPIRLWTFSSAFLGGKAVCEEILKNWKQPMTFSGWGKKPEVKKVELRLGSICIMARNTYLLYGVQTELAELGIPSRLFSGESDWFERSADGKVSQAADQQQFVTLTTIHSSKGLEWPHVFMLGLEDGFFPDKDTPMDHERRLFFVGCTRAVTSLTLVRVHGKSCRLLEPLFPDIQLEIEEIAINEAIEEHEDKIAQQDEDAEYDPDKDDGTAEGDSDGDEDMTPAPVFASGETKSNAQALTEQKRIQLTASDGYVPSRARALRSYHEKKDAAAEKRAAKRATKPLGVGSAVRNLTGKDYIWLKQHVFPADLEKRIEILNKEADEHGSYPEWVKQHHLESDYGTFLECLVHRMLAERINTSTVYDKQLEEAETKKTYSHLLPAHKRRWMDTAQVFRDRNKYPKWSDPKVIEATWWVSLCGGLNVGRRASLYKPVTRAQLTDSVAMSRYRRIEKLVLGFTKGAQTIREAFTVHVEFHQQGSGGHQSLRQMIGELDLCVLRPCADGHPGLEAEVIDFKASFFETDKCRADHLTRLWAYASMLRIMNNSRGDGESKGDNKSDSLRVNRIRITNLLANVQFVFNLEGWSQDQALIEHLIQRELEKREMAK
jgi:ATP-dependent exoDNAse (exonuclease V) beta subunit